MTSKKSAASVKSVIKNIQKRDGSVVPFDKTKITVAVEKSMRASGEGSLTDAEKVTDGVMKEIAKVTTKYKNFVPAVEGVQDMVEKQLILSEYARTAKAYILYRDERARIRAKGFKVPPKVRKLAQDSKNYFRNPLGEFVYYRSYSRWIDEEGRRETWIETVNRYISFMRENLGDKLSDAEYAEVREGILNQEAMPSMRLLQFAGKAAGATNVCAYNCAFTAPEKFQDLAEIMYISMCGTGMGFAVESQERAKVPADKALKQEKNCAAHVIPDNKEGWADSLVHRHECVGGRKRHRIRLFPNCVPAGARLEDDGRQVVRPGSFAETAFLYQKSHARTTGKAPP